MFLSKITGRAISTLIIFILLTQWASPAPEQSFKQTKSCEESKFKKIIKNFLKNKKIEIVSGSASAISTALFCTGLYFYLTNWTIDRENGLIFLKWTPILSLGMGTSTGLLTGLILRLTKEKNLLKPPSKF